MLLMRVEIPVYFYAKETACKWHANHFKREARALKNILDFFIRGLYPRHHSAGSRINYSAYLGLMRNWQLRGY